MAAVRAASTIVVVGPSRSLPDGVLATQERPPGGGPVAALAAGLAVVRHVQGSAELGDEADDPGLLVVLACDMPFVTAPHVETLVTAAAASENADGAAFVDAAGRRQHLAAVYRIEPLTRALGELGDPSGLAMRDLAKRLTVVEVQADPETTLDCDTWPDVRRSRRALEER
jgi:molybdenum cofactor guanylyltransferase